MSVQVEILTENGGQFQLIKDSNPDEGLYLCWQPGPGRMFGVCKNTAPVRRRLRSILNKMTRDAKNQK